MRTRFEAQINPEQYETSKTPPETSKEIEADPVLTPPLAELKGDAQEFFDIVLNKVKFRRVAQFTMVPGSNRMGQLQCTVVWVERAAGRDRVLTYSLAAMLTDPIFPMGRDETAP
jgi:hypothetical protein